MSAVAVAVVGGALVGGYVAGEAQKSAAGDAAYAQTTSYNNATNAELRMWEQARQDFAPYMQAGSEGLNQLQNQLPNYLETTIVPIASQYAGFQPQALPSANFTVNPVTGQVMQYGAPQQVIQQQNALQIPTQGTNLLNPVTSQRATAQTNNALWNQYRNLAGQGENARVITDLNGWMASGNTKVSDADRRQLQNIMQTAQPGSIQTITTGNGMNYVFSVPGNSMNVARQPVQNQSINMSYNPQTQAYEQQPVASTQDLSAGGVLSPVVPQLYQDLNYQFNTNDPVYQQKLKEKTDQINAFLAKQGLLGSTAGETFRQNELNKLLAEEEGRQYNRALTERNYGTQTTADQYGLEAARGNTLYDRMYGQQSDLYNRMLGNTQLTNEQNLATLARPYGVAQDIYNTMYGSAANLANIGSNAAGNTGQQAIQTGQGVASNLIGAGNAMAQSSLAQGQANAQMWNTLGQIPSQVMAYQNYNQPTYTPQYYGGTSNYNAMNMSNNTGLNYY